jgi:hypothetical protein
LVTEEPVKPSLTKTVCEPPADAAVTDVNVKAAIPTAAAANEATRSRLDSGEEMGMRALRVSTQGPSASQPKGWQSGAQFYFRTEPMSQVERNNEEIDFNLSDRPTPGAQQAPPSSRVLVSAVVDAPDSAHD